MSNPKEKFWFRVYKLSSEMFSYSSVKTMPNPPTLKNLSLFEKLFKLRLLIVKKFLE